VTRSGPYAFVRHPLYLGSAIMGVGFVVAARSVIVGAIRARVHSA
jgi:protein-S-isoprenylcysteine O-methyltransferase Ste14